MKNLSFCLQNNQTSDSTSVVFDNFKITADSIEQIVSGIRIQDIIVQKNQLFQNYPNPFNPETVISWQLANGSHVELAVYNLLGEKVATLVSRQMGVGDHNYRFNGRDLPSGIYYYQLVTDNYRQVKKMILLR
jgi:hypothetical protein